MIKKVFFILILFLTIILNTSGQIKESNHGTRMALIDTLSYLKISKLIFYQSPLGLKDNQLVDTNFTPYWYDAYCANFYYKYFENYPKEVVRLLHSKLGVTEKMAAEKLKKLKTSPPNMYQQMFPYRYVFGEIWLTCLKTGEEIVIVLDYMVDSEMPNLEFNHPITEQNKTNEGISSKKEIMNSKVSYIMEDGILKFPNQADVWKKMICNDSSYIISGSIRSFKDILFRAPTYIRSIIKDGKRIFETIENTTDGPVVVKVSERPE